MNIRNDIRTLLMLPSGEVIGHGDTVDVRLTVTAAPEVSDRLTLAAPNGMTVMGARRLGQLADVGAISLVQRAEPDWQPGDFARDRETGQTFLRTAAPLDRPWLVLSGPPGEIGKWWHADMLRGRLERMTLTPEEPTP